MRAPVSNVPEKVFEPLHAPEAVHDDMFELFHASVDAWPVATWEGVADKVNNDSGLITTVTERTIVDPFVPLHVRVYVLLSETLPVDCVPLTAFVPVQLPEATQDIVLIDDQVSVADPLSATTGGAAAKFNSGAGAVGSIGVSIPPESDTVIVTESEYAVPPEVVQEIE